MHNLCFLLSANNYIQINNSKIVHGIAMDKIRCELWICTVALPIQRSAIYATPVIKY